VTKLARTHSLLGVVPLGAYLVVHLYEHWPALVDREKWVDRSVRDPGLAWLGWLMLALLLTHAALGLVRLRREPSAEKNERGLRALQAASGALVVVFLIYHLWQMWGVGAGPHTSARDQYAVLWRDAGRGLSFCVYLLGISAVCFHFGHGLSRSAVTWGLPATPRAVLTWRLSSGVVGLVLWVCMLQLFAHFAIGEGMIAW
jgi:succinate dehydrogenase / fumarate reductase, cytochrome b subunit